MAKQQDLKKLKEIPENVSQELSEMKSSISEIKSEIDGQTNKASELYNRLEKVF